MPTGMGLNRHNVEPVLLAALLAALGFRSLYLNVTPNIFGHWLAGGCAVGIDVFLCILLGMAGLRGSGVNIRVPHRLWALGLVLVLFIAIVVSFGAIYRDSDAILDGNGLPACTIRDALYFSTVTLTTLGYGDYAPVGSGRSLVMWELATGLLYLILVVPVVASRLADFSLVEKAAATTHQVINSVKIAKAEPELWLNEAQASVGMSLARNLLDKAKSAISDVATQDGATLHSIVEKMKEDADLKPFADKVERCFLQ